MRLVLLVAGVFVAVGLLSMVSVRAQECLHKDGESADQRVRREAAIRYLAAVNAVQMRAQQQEGRYVALDAAAGAPPVGFVPRMLFDRWSYLISLKDFFDPCGFTLFSDEHGAIYESHPTRSRAI